MIDLVIDRARQILAEKLIGERFDQTGQRVCYYCGESLEVEETNVLTGDVSYYDYWERDHVFPWSKGGPSECWNLVLACWACNNQKRAKHPLRWLFDNPPDWPDEIAIDFLARMLIDLWVSSGEKAFWVDLDAHVMRDYGMTDPESIYLSIPRGATSWPLDDPTCSKCGGQVMAECSAGFYTIKLWCPACGLDRVLEAWPKGKKGVRKHGR